MITCRYSETRRSPIILPARSSSGGMKSAPAISPFAMAGAAVITMTNRMAWVVAPNRMMANGTQTIEGSVCSAVIREPTAARSGLIRDTRAPTTVPRTRAIANPMTARRSVVPSADQNWAVCTWCHRSVRVVAGPGRIPDLNPLRWISCQTASAITSASSLGQATAQIFSRMWRLACCGGASSSWSRPARAAAGSCGVSTAMADDLLTQPVLDLDREPDRIRGTHPARPLEVNPEFADHPPEPAAQQHHPVTQPDRLADLVGDEHDAQLAAPPDPLQHLVQQIPGHRVQRAEGLVHQQHVGVLGQ